MQGLPKAHVNVQALVMGLLVGRDGELDALRRMAEEARSGSRVAVVIDGVAGIGKSRLVDVAVGEFLRAGEVTTIAHGVELAGGELPYAGVSEWLRNLVGVVGVAAVREAAGSDLPVLATLCPSLGASAELDRTRLLRAMVGLVEQLAAHRLVCLIVEDLQWIDSCSRDVLAYLVKTAVSGRLLIAVTVRTTDRSEGEDAATLRFAGELVRAPGASRLTLGPLSRAEVGQQAASLAPGAREPRLVDRLVELSGGVPFLVEQLVLAGVEATGPVPPSVWAPMQTRVRGLDPEALRLVQVAALAEGFLDHQVLQLVWLDAVAARAGEPDAFDHLIDAGDGRFEAAVTAAVHQQILVFDPGTNSYAFTHALLREAVASTLDPGDRLAWHRCWARQLSRPESLARDSAVRVVVAQHWVSAGATVEALDAVMTAADTCGALGAEREVARLLHQALDLWDRVPDSLRRPGLTRDDVLSRACEALFACDDEEAATVTLASELRRSDARDDPVRELCLRVLLADAQEDLGRQDDPQVWEEAFARWEEMAARPPSPLCCTALRWIAIRVGDMDPARGEEIRARTLALAARLGDLQLLRGVTGDSVAEAAYQGRFDDAMELVKNMPRQAFMSAVDRSEHDQALALAAHHGGHYIEAEGLLRRSQTRLPDPELAPWLCRGNELALSETLIALGRWAEARDRLRLLRQQLKAPSPLTAWASRTAGVLACHSGDIDSAVGWLRLNEQCLPSSYDPVRPDVHVGALHLAAEVALLREGPASALGRLTPLWRSPITSRAMDAWLVVVFGARLHGDLAALAERGSVAVDAPELEAFRDAAAAVPRHTALADTWWAHVEAELARARHDDNADQWAGIVSRWRQIGHVPAVAYALVRHGAAALAEGRRNDAADSLAEALEIVTRLGAEPLRDLLLTIARRGRIRLASNAVAGNQSDLVRARLTARELEVLGLIAQGLTNAEIADTLFVSPKTASVHVSRILAKLGAATRSKAAVIAYANGIVASPDTHGGSEQDD